MPIDSSIPKFFILCLLLISGLLAGPALAAFSDNPETLLISVYNVNSTTGDTEYGFDTGIDLGSINWSQPFSTTVQTGLSLASFAATTNWSDLQVGLYGFDLNDGSTTYGRFYAASSDANNALNGTQYGAMRNATKSIRAAYTAADTNSDNVALLPNNLTSNNTYDILMNGTVTPGNYASFNALNAPSGEANLGVFGDSDPNNNIITMYLYGYQRTGVQASTGTYLTNGLVAGIPYMAVITLDSNGNLTIENSAPTDPCAGHGGDADGDGVCDDADLCPNTAAGASVAANGCATNQCPTGTLKAGQEPGQCGCNVADTDSDSDGVADCNDQCPNTPGQIVVPLCGCGSPQDATDCNDYDGDGMPNAWETANGLDPLTNDRNLDLDGDGFTNYQEYLSGTNPNSNASQPARPTATAADQTVASGASVALTATAAQGSNPIAAFAWSQTQGTAVTPSQVNDIPNRSSTITFTAPAVASGQTATLRFAITVTDSEGIASSPATLVTVTVQSAGNNPPSAPGLHSPAISPERACQVTTPTPTLTVSNATDIDGDAIHIEFSVARDAGFTDLLTQIVVVPQSSGNTTAWTYSGSALAENTLYYWRARACDAAGCSGFMVPSGFFFVNAVNTPPNAPVLVSPGDGLSVSSLRPTFTVDLTPYTDATDRYDTHTYRLLVSTDSSFASGSLVVDQTYGCAAGGEQDIWQVTPAGNLTEDATYYWRVVYGDDGGTIHTPFSGQTATRSFVVNVSTNVPRTPTNLIPSGGIDVTTSPVLSFQDNGDQDSPTLNLVVELATDDTFSANSTRWSLALNNVQESGSAVVRTVDLRAQQGLVLIENQIYSWRVRVTDDGTNWVNSAIARFRFNAINEPPVFGPIQNPSPADHVTWHAGLAPTFQINGASDPEGAAVYYRFALFAQNNPQAAPVDESDLLSTSTWPLNKGAALENSTTYFWQVIAYDGPDEATAASASSPMFSFTTAVNFYQPTVPTLNTPYSGGTVGELQPTLRVNRSTDDDGNSLDYIFELYSCPNLSCQQVDLTAPAGDDSGVSVNPVSALTVGHTYYWRVRAIDQTAERHTSAWMPTASFTVVSEDQVPSYSVQIKLSQIASCEAADTQLFTVVSQPGDSDADRALNGLQVQIPPGALTGTTGDINLMIGRVEGAPAPQGKIAVGQMIFLAPEGITFEPGHPVMLRIPVVDTGIQDPAAIQVLTYDAGARKWIPVTGAVTFSENPLIVHVALTHFSLYTLALEDTTITPGGGTDATGGGGGGSSGGCFIGSMAVQDDGECSADAECGQSSTPATNGLLGSKADHGQRSMPWALLFSISLLSVAVLVLIRLRHYRKENNAIFAPDLRNNQLLIDCSSSTNIDPLG